MRTHATRHGWRQGTALALTALALAACGGNDSDDPTDPPPVNVAPVAADDTLSLLPGQTMDLLANDTLNGAAARSGAGGNVTYGTTGTLPTGVSVTEGVVGLADDVAPGTYSIAYQLCLPGSTTCDTATASLTIPAYGYIAGRALDANTGMPVEGANVRLGDRAATTDATGSYRLPAMLLTDRVSVVFDGANHIETSRIGRVVAGTTQVDVRMLPFGSDITLPIATGGTATVPGSVAQVTLPAAGLVRSSDGAAATGDVRVRITPIAPALDSAQMPGDYQTQVDGTLAPLQSWGAMNVQLSDSAGNALNLAPGAQATIRIPLSTRNSEIPASVPLYHFDQPNGVWIEEGTAALAGEMGARYYEGTVTHFTTWNADRVYDTVTVKGCAVNDAGERLANVFITSDGISYSGTSSGYTNADGNFEIPAMMNGRLAILGSYGGLFTNTVSVTTGAGEYVMEECLRLSNFSNSATIRLTWGEMPSDLDSHIVAPDGTRVYYGSKGSLATAPFVNLDVDDTSSFGPEVVTLSRLMVGTYRYGVHNYSGQGSRMISESGARVELNVAGQALQLMMAPSGDDLSTAYWNVFDLQVDSHCNVTVTRVNTYTSSGPSVTPVTAEYCTP